VEKALQAIWERQSFDHSQLCTTDGEPLQIYYAGKLNRHAGPDFHNAHIKVGNLEWFGNVEIHQSSKEWFTHKHHKDAGYNPTILHVVFSEKHFVPAERNDGTYIPTLELSQRVHNPEKQEELSTFVCKSLPKVDAVFYELIAQKVHQRFATKAQYWQIQFHQKFKYNPEKLACSLLLHGLFSPQNQLPASLLSHTLSSGILHRLPRHLWSDVIMHLSGLLPNIPTTLNCYLPIIDALTSPLEPSLWQMGKYRPKSAPLIKLAWIASIIQNWDNSYDSMLDATTYSSFIERFQSFSSITEIAGHTLPAFKYPNGYKPGISSLNLIFINTILPYQFWKYQRAGKNPYELLQELKFIKPEVNYITKEFTHAGFPTLKNAFHSQGAIELFKNTCEAKKCMSCPIYSFN